MSTGRQRRSGLVGTAFAVVALAVAATGCGGSSGGSASASGPSSMSGMPTAAASPAGSSSTPVAGTTINIKNFAFSPSTLTVAPGAKITVHNNDTSAPHTVTAVDKSFDTGTIDPGKTATFTAPTKPGRYPYICTVHPYMKGTLVVSG